MHYLHFKINWVKAFGRQSDRRSSSPSRGPYIFRYFDVFGPVSVLKNMKMILLGDYSPCVGKLYVVGSLTRPACNDSGDALHQRLSGQILLNPSLGVLFT